jgi:hypothetical protein
MGITEKCKFLSYFSVMPIVPAGEPTVWGLASLGAEQFTKWNAWRQGFLCIGGRPFRETVLPCPKGLLVGPLLMVITKYLPSLE